MIKFAAFVPHPPVAVPEIGGQESKYCTETCNAFKKLAERIDAADIDTLVIVSPHSTIHPQEMTISFNDQAYGDFSQFQRGDIFIKKEIDTDLAEDIYKKSQAKNVKTRLLEHNQNFLLDHGVLVPLNLMQQFLPTQLKIVVIGYSLQSRQKHIDFGEAIAEAAAETDQHIALICSGDLSHRLLENGSEFIGQKFDKLILDNIQNYNPDALLALDPHLQEEAGECGYRSLLIAIGVIKELSPKPEVLSYQAPFGVGYLVADFGIKK